MSEITDAVSRINALLEQHAVTAASSGGPAPNYQAAVLSILDVIAKYGPTMLPYLSMMFPNNPIITEVVAIFPTILPFLTELEAALKQAIIPPAA